MGCFGDLRGLGLLCTRRHCGIHYDDNDSAWNRVDLVRNCRHGSGIWRSHRFVALRGKAFDTRGHGGKRELSSTWYNPFVLSSAICLILLHALLCLRCCDFVLDPHNVQGVQAALAGPACFEMGNLYFSQYSETRPKAKYCTTNRFPNKSASQFGLAGCKGCSLVPV